MEHGDRSNIVVAVLLLLSVVTFSRGASLELDRAQELYQRTAYQSALNILLPLSPKSAAVNALIGKTYYLDEQYKNSTTYLKKAVIEDPLNSSYFEYYLEAPGIVGGGIDKAENVASRIRGLNKVEGHYALARIAEKLKDGITAEREYRKAMQLAPGDVGRVIDLATFLSVHGRYQESETVFDSARQMAPDSPKLIYARAASYVRTGRNLPEARALIQRYIESQHSPDDPSRSEVERLLRASQNREVAAPGASF